MSSADLVIGDHKFSLKMVLYGDERSRSIQLAQAALEWLQTGAPLEPPGRGLRLGPRQSSRVLPELSSPVRRLRVVQRPEGRCEGAGPRRELVHGVGQSLPYPCVLSH